ncbi:hypothetical protein ASG67_02290 [Sphingomonas sp. Leaf339]|uniref:glycosyltransferase family 39 protein n=1 Tax=Sphingomonas sp. Leaf339 TaxID=1736343 RepID=UPI0006F2FD45|nr:glycosyltransferase family 39 protein [Sphingomonas sp. Leaf339]KQU61995.1 hypothetical protein ASG67_02290 [Sphingomonas sp. Leaf339]
MSSSVSIRPVVLLQPAWRDWRVPASATAQFLLLLAAAIATRGALYGNPVIHSDEQFYLLVGDRMLHGAWPFVDIFDRKPVGLFLIFAAIRSIGGNGILMYQLAATLTAAGTAFLVTRIAGRFTTRDAAFAGGLFYLIWLVVFDGAGGQSAVWGNALMAGAALIVVDAMAAKDRVRERGTLAMLLVGVAMQVKYTAMFEGIFFGLTLMWTPYRAERPLPGLAIDAACWVAAALVPTALAWSVYALAGHDAAFVFANFLSIFGQQDDDTFWTDVPKVAGALALSAPLLLMAWRGRRRGAWPLAWVGAALVAIYIMGTCELLYWLPLALPLSIAAALGLDRHCRWASRQVVAVVLIFGAIGGVTMSVVRVERRGTAAQITRLVDMIGPAPRGCLFTFGAEPILYYLTRSCLPTRYVFRSHLGQISEIRGTGIDPVAEVARLLAARPGVIVMRAPKPATNPATRVLVERAVATRYDLVGTVQIGELPQSVYRLRPLARP